MIGVGPGPGGWEPQRRSATAATTIAKTRVGRIKAVPKCRLTPALKRFLRITVAIALTSLALYWWDPRRVLAAAAGADWRWLAAAVALVLVDRTLMAMRWLDLLVALAPGSRPPLGTILRVFFVSSFVSNFVPSVAADLYRAYALSRHDVHLAESTASVLMDRALGVLSVLLVGAAALPFVPHFAGRGAVVVALLVMFALCAVATAVVFSERAAGAVRSAAAVIPFPTLHRITDALTDAVRRYADDHGPLVRVLALSVLVQIFRVLQAWCLGQALGIALPLVIYMAFIPIIVLIIQLPITINGLGTTQLAFDYLFVPAGAPGPHVIALSVLFLALGIVGTLPGGPLYALGEGLPVRRADGQVP
jgi:uncharacterized protein (TIRG00374 family)